MCVFGYLSQCSGPLNGVYHGILHTPVQQGCYILVKQVKQATIYSQCMLTVRSCLVFELLLTIISDLYLQGLQVVETFSD